MPVESKIKYLGLSVRILELKIYRYPMLECIIQLNVLLLI